MHYPGKFTARRSTNDPAHGRVLATKLEKQDRRTS